MKTEVKNLLGSLRYGKPLVVHNVAVIPLFTDSKSALEYLTMEEALKENLLHIGEIFGGGSVPTLIADNLADKPVLLIDGEELVGVKQNRVLNLSVLLKEKTKTDIPVSCVERGRWGYREPYFPPPTPHTPPEPTPSPDPVEKPKKKKPEVVTEHFMALRGRARKMYDVTRNIECYEAPHSDQGKVWEEVDKLQQRTQVHSPTSAMYDVYVKRKDDLTRFLEGLKPEPNQCGYILFINGKPQALEIIPRPDKYNLYHKKLIESGAIEALADVHLFDKTYDEAELKKMAEEFVKAVMESEEHPFEKVGYGKNLRYRRQGFCGAALVHNDEVVHSAFFSISDGEEVRRRPSIRPGLW